MKTVLISPKGPLYRHRGGIFKRSLRYAPLTLTTLAALVPPGLNAEFQLIDEGIEDVDLNLDADLVGMTVITGTAMRAYELSAHFRGRGIPVVLGGPHVTLVPDDAQPHGDTIVVGYAEETWPQLVRDFAAGRLQPRYVQRPGLTYIPFATTRAGRETVGDPRLSIEERYEGLDDFLQRIRSAAMDLVRRRYFLQDDLDDVLAGPKSHWSYATRERVSSSADGQ